PLGFQDRGARSIGPFLRHRSDHGTRSPATVVAASDEAILQLVPGEDRRHEPGLATVEGYGARWAKIERRAALCTPEHVERGLLAGPARPHHAGPAVAGRVVDAVVGEDARDHVTVHGDVAEPAVGHAGAVELGKDIGERALQP